MVSAVFDSTVLISAFLTPKGVSGELLDLSESEFTLVLAQPIIDETRGVLLTRRRLRAGFGYTDQAVATFCDALEALAMLVTDLPDLQGVVRDPNDDVILAVALGASADYLVTRDKDLLDLGRFEAISIVTPERFRALLRAASS